MPSSKLIVVTALVSAGMSGIVPSQALATGDVNQTTCPAMTESTPGFRSYLPDCRAYELVSPPYKEGGLLATEPAALSASGEDMVLGFAGAFGGVENEPFDPNRAQDFAAFHLVRTDAGWRYTPLTPSSIPYKLSALLAVSADERLSSTLWGAQTNDILLHKEDIYMQREAGPGQQLARVGPGEAPELAGEELTVGEELSLVGASQDLTRSVYSVTAAAPVGHSDLWPGDTTQNEAKSLYEYVYDGIERAEPVLVGVANPEALHGSPHLNEGAMLVSDCGTELGGGSGSAYNAISQDGEAIFFTALKCAGSPVVNEVWARLGAERSVKISEPTTGDCAACNTASPQDAVFAGASQDGEKVFFTTEQELLPGQSTTNLYEYDFKGEAGKKITLVSEGSTKPEVQGVVRISEDGERVYFVAKSVLAGANAEGDSPEEGADNLYVYEPDPGRVGAHRVVFVAKVLTEAEEAAIEGEESAEASIVNQRAEQIAYAAYYEALSKGTSEAEAFKKLIETYEGALQTLPGTLGPAGTLAEDRLVWQTEDRRPAQTTPDGRFLVFLSSADLRGEGLVKVPQLFEYDAEGGATKGGALKRISIGQSAFGNNGDVSTFYESAQIPPQSFVTVDLPTSSRFRLAVSDDGSKVFFTSAARLAPGAVSGAPSVFEYSAGEVFLISDGRDASKAGIGVPTVQLYGGDGSGRDVFFTTANRLVPQSAETQQALYDAREEGGFPAPIPLTECAGETCRGEAGIAPQLSGALSATQPGGDNLPPPSAKRSIAKRRLLTRKQKLARALRACHKKRDRKRRAACRRLARKRYGGK